MVTTMCVFVALLITRVTRLEFLTDFTDLFYFFCIFMESVAFETRCKGKWQIIPFIFSFVFNFCVIASGT